MDTIRAFFRRLRKLFPIFKKGQGRPPTLTPCLCACAQILEFFEKHIQILDVNSVVDFDHGITGWVAILTSKISPLNTY